MKEYIIELSDNENALSILVKAYSLHELVRCKDCAYALFKEGLVEHGHIFCTKPFTERWQAVKPNDWFCADGERR